MHGGSSSGFIRLKLRTHALNQKSLHSALFLDFECYCFGPVDTGHIIDSNIASFPCEFEANKFAEATERNVSLNMVVPRR
jgi:hypothetical protein